MLSLSLEVMIKIGDVSASKDSIAVENAVAEILSFDPSKSSSPELSTLFLFRFCDEEMASKFSGQSKLSIDLEQVAIFVSSKIL